MITPVSAHQSILNNKSSKRFPFTKSLWQLLSLFAVSVILSACDGDTLNAVPDAGDPGLDDLAANKFLTDAAFAPKIESIDLYDICRRGTNGLRCDPTDGSSVNQNSNTLPTPGQKAVSSPVRLLVTMDKSVFLDQGAQEDISLQNAEFIEASGSLQPVIAPNSDFTAYIEPSNDPESLSRFKYSLFTTEHTGGHIQPNEDGTVTVTVPAGIVYDINVNGKKIYNTAASFTFEYDTSRPVPKLKLIDRDGIIERSGKMSALASSFGKVELEIDWGEDVTFAENTFNETVKDSALLGFSCVSFNCPGGLRKDPTYVYYGPSGSGRVFDESKSTGSKYYVSLSETDTTGDDQMYLTRFADGVEIRVELAEGLVKDKAGNLNKAARPISLKIDAIPPKLASVALSLDGGRLLTEKPGDRGVVLKIGDRIRYRLSTDEPVFVKDSNDIVVDFDIGVTPVKATVLDTQLSQQRAILDLVYTVQEGVGDNRIGYNKASEYYGQGNSSDLTTDWRSDIGAVYDIVSNNKVFDLVDNPIDQANFRDRYFLKDSEPVSGKFEDHVFAFMHVDGVRPRVMAEDMSRYSRRLSGSDSKIDASIVANGNKLAIAVPFSEKLYLSRNTQLAMDSQQIWGNTKLEVLFFSDKFGLQQSSKRKRATLSYDHALTQVAKSDSFFSGSPSVLVYSIVVDDTFTSSDPDDSIESVRLGKLTAKPAGISPTDLLDYAGNSFDPDQSESDGFSFPDDFVVDIAVDGGPFNIRSIYPIYKDKNNFLVAVDPSLAEQKYNDSDVLYVGVQLTRPVKSVVSLLTSPELTLSIKNSAGVNVDVTSDSVVFGSERSKDLKSLLVFGFSLNNGLYEDGDGVEVVSLVDPSDEIQDENGTSLNKTISNVRGGTKTLQQVRVDNKHPLCSNAFLTDSSTGLAPASPITLGVSDVLYMVLECDQAVTHSQGPNGADDKAFIWTSFGDVSVGAIDILFRYFGSSDGGKKLIYSLPIELGYRPGSNGQVLAGELGNLTLRKYYNESLKVGGEFDFFTDSFGNPVVLGFNSNYFLSEPVYGVNSTGPGKTAIGAITVDVAPAPVQVRYKLPQGSYVDANGVAYISGGDKSRADKRNSLILEVDYGYFDASGDAQLRNLLVNSDVDASIDIAFSDGTPAGRADFIKFGPNKSTMIYEMRVGYQGTSPSNLSVRSVQVGDKLRPVADRLLPYIDNSVITYKASGAPVAATLAVETPIKSEFLATAAGLSSLPSLKINNKRPELLNDIATGKYPIEVWWVDGVDLKQLKPRGAGSNLSTLYFGDIYFALVFDKDVTEDSFSGSTIAVDVSTDSGLLRVSAQKMAWVNKSSLASLGNSGAALSDNKVFYKFSYDRVAYHGKAFKFADPFINVTSGMPQDIYGNEVDVADVSAITKNVVYDVTTDSLTDLGSLVFDKKQYRFNDSVKVTVETRGRIDIGSSLNSSQVLALKARVTKNEAATNPAEKTIILSHVSAINVDPATAPPLGKTIINFEYNLTDISEQFDDDNTADADLGIVPFGSILRCPDTSVSASCAPFSVRLLDVSGVSTRSASLGVNDLVGIGSLAGVNTASPKVVVDLGNPLSAVMSIKYKTPIITTAQPLSSSTTLKKGDFLVFSVPLTLQNPATNALTYDSSVADKPIFNFNLFNLSNSINVVRQANFKGIDGSNLTFEYEVKAGDYVGRPANDEAIKLSDGTDSLADRPAKFNTSSLFISALSSDSFQSITDKEYGNPLYRRVVDSSGNRSSIQYDLTGDLVIDTRPYVVDIVSITPTNKTYSSNEDIQFYATMSEDVNVSAGAAFTVKVTDSSGGFSEIKAVYSGSYFSGDLKKPIFEFTSPSGVSGTASVDSFNLDGVSTFIRSVDGQVNVNPKIAPVSDTVKSLTFDSLEPKIIGFSLVSPPSVNPPFSYVSGTTLKIKAKLDKPVDIEVAAGSAEPSISIALAKKSSSVPMIVNMIYKGGSAKNVTEMIFELPVNGTTLPEVEDSDGLTVDVAQVSLPGGVSINSSAGSNPMATGFAGTALTEIEALDLNIDISPPLIKRVLEIKGKVVGAAVDYSADNDIIFQVTFDETVDLLNANSAASFDKNHYKLNFDFDGNLKSAVLDLDTTSDTTSKKEYYFKVNTASGFEAYAGTASLTSFVVDAASKAEIKDKAGNLLNATLLQASQDFSKLQIDAIKPTVVSASVNGGLYADQAVVKAHLTMSEVVNVVGSPQLEVTLSGGSLATPVKALFTYDRTADADNTDKKVVFTYQVDQSLFSSGKTDKAQITGLKMDAANYAGDSFANNVVTPIPNQAIESGVVIDPSLGASVVSVEAWVKENGLQPKIINPDTTAQIYGSKDLLYMVVEFGREIELNSNTTVRMDFTSDSGQVLSFNKTKDIGGGTNNKTLTFVLDPMPSGIKAMSGIRTTGQLVVGGTPAEIGVKGLSSLASPALSKKFANDKDLDDVLETVLINTAPPVVKSISVNAPSYYKEGATIVAVLEFDSNVQVSGAPELLVDIGGTERTFVFTSNNGNKALFEYTVVAGENDSDGIELKTLRISSSDSIIDDNRNSAKTGDTDISSINLASPVFVDTTNPHTLSFIKAIDDFGDVTGDVPNGGTTDDKQLDLVWNLKNSSGTTAGIELGSKVQLYGGLSGTTKIGTAHELTQAEINSGEVTLTTTPQTAGTTPVFNITLIDAAGNNSSPTTNAFKVTFDLLKPLAPTLHISDEDGYRTDANVTDGEVVDSTELVMTVSFGNSDPQFTVVPGDSVKIYDGTNVLETETIIQQNIDDGNLVKVAVKSLAYGKTYSFAAGIVDKAGNIGRQSPVIKVTIEEPPAPDDINPSSFYDKNGDDNYSVDDTIILRFNQPIEFSLLSANREKIETSLGGVIGNSSLVNSISNSGGFTNEVRIVLATPPSGEKQLQPGEKLTIPSEYVRNAKGIYASVDAVFTLKNIRPAPRDELPFEHDDKDSSNSYSKGDIVTLHFNQAIVAGSGGISIASLSVDNTKFFGVGASISPTTGLHSTYEVTLGDSVDIASGDKISALSSDLVNSSGVKATMDAVFVVADKAPNKRVLNPVVFEDKDSSKTYTSGDLVSIFFNQPVKVGLPDFDKVDDLVLETGKTLGTNATMTARGTVSSATAEFQITLGTGARLTEGDTIIVSQGLVKTLAGVSSISDIVFELPDITPPGGLYSRALTFDVGVGNDDAYGPGDQIELAFNEPINASLISSSSILVSDGKSLGSSASATVQDFDNDGFGDSILITLGAGSTITASETVTVNKQHVEDRSRNRPSSNISYSLEPASTVMVKDVSIDAGLYTSGEEIKIRVAFTDTINVDLAGAGMELTMNVGGSLVNARYIGTINGDTMEFVYHASGTIDLDGVEVIGSSITKASGASITSNGANVVEIFVAQTFPNVTVNAPFEFSKVTDIWFDATDVDGDDDTTDQTVDVRVPFFHDKSGKDNHIWADSNRGRIGPIIRSGPLNNGNLSLFFGHLTSGWTTHLEKDKYALGALKKPNLGSSGYSYFVSFTKPTLNGFSYQHNSLFGTRGFDDGVALVTSLDNLKMHLNSVSSDPSASAGINYGSTTLGTILTTSTMFASDSSSPGIRRIYSQSDRGDKALSIQTNLIPGETITMGATGSGKHPTRAFINEAFYFNRSLTLAEKAITENYIASKWASPEVVGRDYYSGDNAAKGNYDYGVTGILKLPSLTVGSYVVPASNVSAASVGGLLIANSSSDGFLKDDGDRVFAGHKGSGVVKADLPLSSSTSTVRSNKVWYLDIEDAGVAGGNIDIAINPSEINLNFISSSSSYELLWRAGESGAFTRVAVGREVLDGKVLFRNLAIKNDSDATYISAKENNLTDGYITLGMVDSTPPSLRYAEVTSAGEIELFFDEAIANVGGLSLSSNTFDTAKIHASLANKVVIKATNSINSVDTVSYNGSGLSGVAGNALSSLADVVVGTSGDDSISLSNSSIVVAGKGNDTITASSNADVFDYNFVTDGDDVINGFSAGADKIDLSDLLQYSGRDLSSFIDVADDGTHTTLSIDAQGKKNTSASTRDISITINNLSGRDLDKLVNGGLLIVQ